MMVQPTESPVSSLLVFISVAQDGQVDLWHIQHIFVLMLYFHCKYFRKSLINCLNYPKTTPLQKSTFRLPFLTPYSAFLACA